LSKDRLTELLPVGTNVYMRTYKDSGKYGRYIADIYIPQEDGTLICVNDMMVEEGLAIYQDY
jgi:endonuclease YncB( thermonuclease family)